MDESVKFSEDGAAIAILFDLAAFGLVDFRQAKLLDPLWRRKIRAMVQAMLRRHQLEVVKAEVIYSGLVGVIAATATPTNNVREVVPSLVQHGEAVSQVYFPWRVGDKKQIPDWAEQASQRWKEAFGDPDDEQVQQRIQQTVDALLSRPSERE